jgi:RAB6A-GEF complex partner protein 2
LEPDTAKWSVWNRFNDRLRRKLTPLLSGSSRTVHNPIPSRHRHARKVSTIDLSSSSPVAGQFSSHSGSSSPPPTLATISENGNHQLDDVFGRKSTDSLTSEAQGQPRHRSLQKHSRQPSYLNAYGADTLGIALHENASSAQNFPQPGEINILWAHTRIRGHFTPSSSYIPPDPLLPLRSLLLHQPLGSGSLMPADTPSSSKRWSLTFGSGTIGQEDNPSLTGSLLGLAKGLVWGGQSGTLEDERRKVWTTKELPVFETIRSLIGVDVRLQPGESRSCESQCESPIRLER